MSHEGSLLADLASSTAGDVVPRRTETVEGGGEGSRSSVLGDLEQQVDRGDPGTEPYVIVAVTGEVTDGHSDVMSSRFAFVRVGADGTVTNTD